MNTQDERKTLEAEVEQFKMEAMKMHVVECWASTYRTDPFSYFIDENKVVWTKSQARQLWGFWKAGQALEAKKFESKIQYLNVQLSDVDGYNYLHKKEIEELKIAISGTNAALFEQQRINGELQDKLLGVDAVEMVVVPVECPDPDFADMLFDELRKYAIGTFGDDMLIHFSNIDEEKIWALMVEVARGGK